MENKILGVEKKEIRKYYFKGKIPVLLAEIQAEQKIEDPKDLEELTAYLYELEKEKDKTLKKIKEDLGGEILGEEEINHPPTVEELRGGVSDEEWRAKADVAIRFIKDALDTTRQMISKRHKIPGTYWLDTAIVFISYFNYLDRDRVYKDQLYRMKMTEIIDRYEISRKEAEERAKLTKEYSDYKNALLLKERVIEFIQMCKKEDGTANRN